MGDFREARNGTRGILKLVAFGLDVLDGIEGGKSPLRAALDTWNRYEPYDKLVTPPRPPPFPREPAASPRQPPEPIHVEVVQTNAQPDNTHKPRP